MANNIITPDDGFLVKDLRFDPVNTTTHEPVTLIVPGDHEKIATGMHPEILTFLGENPRPKNITRIIVTALGAYDAYGSNVNGDGFHEKDLLHVPTDIWLGSKKYSEPMYRTFVDFARIYSNHRNRLHDHAYGVIPHSIYNREMKRVENILDIFEDDPGGADIIQNQQKELK